MQVAADGGAMTDGVDRINGWVARMNRTIKDATVERCHDDSRDRLRPHLTHFMATCKFARRLETLGGLTPYEYIRKVWTSEPDRFVLGPIYQMPGPNSRQESAIGVVGRTRATLSRSGPETTLRPP